MAEKKTKTTTARAAAPPPAPSSNPLVIVNKMIERQVDPDALKKMMDIYERWQIQQAEAAYASAMVQCQRKVPAILKDAQNIQTKSRYPRIETILDAIVPVYTGEGMSICFTEEPSAIPGKVRFVAIVTHELGCSKQYARNASPDDGKGPKGGTAAMNAIQAEGSTNTYVRKMLMGQVFNLRFADEQDDDGNAVGKLGPKDIEALNELIEDCRTAGKPVDNAKFLRWALDLPDDHELAAEIGVKDVPLSRLGEAAGFLTRRARKAREEAAAKAKKEEESDGGAS